jgi:hypothetical protein
VWHRAPGPAAITLDVLRATITPTFPTDAAGWTYTWTDDSLTIATTVPEPSARVIRLGTRPRPMG